MSADLFTRQGPSKPRESIDRLLKPKSQRDVAKEAIERYRYSRGLFAPHRRDWEMYYNAYATDPWDSSDRAKLEEEGRVNAVFSYTTKVINAVVGLNMSDRKEHRFEAATTQQKDVAVANWMTRLVRHVWQKGGGPRVDSQVLLDLLVTGYGWGNVYIDNTRRANRIRPQHIPVWEMFPDPDCSQPNMTDAKWICRLHTMDIDFARMQWPDANFDGVVTSTAPPVSSPFPRSVSADGYDDEASSDMNVEVDGALQDGTVRVLEYQRKVYERYVTFDQGGVTQSVPIAEFNRIKKAYLGAVDGDTGLPTGEPIQGIEEWRCQIKRAFILMGTDEGEVLDDAILPVDTFTYQVATGLPQRHLRKGRTTYFGLMKLAYEPQLWSSRNLSLLLEIMGRTAKGGVYIEEDAVEDVEEFERQYAIPGGTIVLKPHTLRDEKIKDRQPGQLPTAFQMMAQMAQQAVQDATGVTDYTTGAETAERSNVLVNNLQQQTIATLNPLLDGHTVYQMGMGTLTLQVALAALSPAAIDRILGPQELEGVTVQTDPETGEPQPIASAYQLLLEQDTQELGVQVDTGSASPVERQRLWSVLADQGLLQKMMELAPNEVREVLPDFFDLMPVAPEISGKIASKLRALLQSPTLEEVNNRLQQLSPEDQQQIFAMLQQQFAPPPEEGGDQQAQEQPPAEEPVQ